MTWHLAAVTAWFRRGWHACWRSLILLLPALWISAASAQNLPHARMAGVESEKLPEQKQTLPDWQHPYRDNDQNARENWPVQAILPPTTHQPDRLLDARGSEAASQLLTPYLAVYEDPGASLTLSDMLRPERASQFRFGPAHAEAFSFGYSRSSFWLRLYLDNPSKQALRRLLEVGEAQISVINVYQSQSDGTYSVQQTGIGMPFTSRPYPNRHFVFPLTIPAQSHQTIYLQVQSANALLIPARLWSEPAFHHYERNDYIAQAWYFGMSTAMILFNLLLYLALREKLYLYYVCFATMSALSLSILNGLSKEFLWPGYTPWAASSLSVCFALTIMTLLAFMRHMLDTACLVPRLDRLLRLAMLMLVGIVLGLGVAYQSMVQLATELYLLLALLILGTSLYCATRHDRSSIFFVAAFSLLMLSAALSALRALSLVPTNNLTVYGIQVGSALEMVLLALALADRLHIILQEKEQAQRDALAAQQHLVESLQSSERKLEQRVDERTSALAQSNDALSEANQALQQAFQATLDSHQQAAHAEQEAHSALNALHTTQTQLVQSEKMAALGQLISSVGQEISAPINQVRRDGKTMSDALHQALASMAQLFPLLGQTGRESMLALLEHSLTSNHDPRRLAEAKPARFAVLLAHPQAALIFTTVAEIRLIARAAADINDCANRVSRIIAALKRYSHFDPAEQWHPVNLQEGMETVLTIFQGRIERTNRLVRQYEAVAPVSGLPDQLNQVWSNLILNALQAMQQPGCLTISIRRDGAWALVAISDTGCGIAPDLLGHIFEPFFTTHPDGGSNGLGLGVVKQIIDKHHGRVEVASTVGRGTTVSVYLPLSA